MSADSLRPKPVWARTLLIASIFRPLRANARASA